MIITYYPSKDELQIRFCPIKDKPNKKLGRFKLWWGDEGNICALDIKPFTDELEEFKRNLSAIQLGGIWKGVRVNDEDIKEGRQELLRKIEEKW